jgi:hypothetical protein
MALFGKKVSSKVTSDDINEAKKLIRQFGGFLRIAEIIERLGNVEASAAESESSLVGLSKKKESASKDLASMNVKVKKAEAELVTANKIRDAAIDDTKKIDIQNRNIEKDQVSKRSAHESVMLVYARDEDAALKRISEVREKAEYIIGKANTIKIQAAQEKADANKLTRSLEDKKLELEQVEQSIANARADAKSQMEQALKKF